MNHNLVADASRDPPTQLSVVIEFQLIAQRIFDLNLLMVPHTGRRRHDFGIESHFSASSTGDDVSVQSVHIRLWRLRLEPDSDRYENCDYEYDRDCNWHLPTPWPAPRALVPLLAGKSWFALRIADSRWQPTSPATDSPTQRR